MEIKIEKVKMPDNFFKDKYLQIYDYIRKMRVGTELKLTCPKGVRNLYQRIHMYFRRSRNFDFSIRTRVGGKNILYVKKLPRRVK